MKTLLLAILAAAAATLQAPSPAKCAYCYSGTCYSSSMCAGAGCICIKRGYGPQGVCVGVQ